MNGSLTPPYLVSQVSALEDKQATRVSALSERVSMLERGCREEDPSRLPVDTARITLKKGTDEEKHTMTPSPDSGSCDDSNFSPSEVAPRDGRPRGRRLQGASRGNPRSLQEGDREVGTSSGSGLVTSSPSKPSRSIPKPQQQPRGLGGGWERGSTPDSLPVERCRCSLGTRTHGKQVPVPRAEGRSPSTGWCAGRDRGKGDAVSRRVENGGRRQNCERREAGGEQVTTMVDEGDGRLGKNERGARAEDGEAWELLEQMPASAATVASVCVLDGVGNRVVSPINRTTTNGSRNRCSREDAATLTEREVMERVGSSKKGGHGVVHRGASGETWNPFAESMSCEGCCSGRNGFMPQEVACGDVRFTHTSSSAAVARRLEELRREKEAFRRVMTGRE